MARTKQFLLEQIARAKRLAMSMNTQTDRERFAALAADYERELNDAEPANGPPTPPSPTNVAAPASDAVAGNEGGIRGTTVPPAEAGDDQEPTAT
jgi:hypothetical protein